MRPLSRRRTDGRGLFGAALLFIRWDPTGHNPVGHVESEHLAWGHDPADAERRLGALSLFDVKAALDQAILDRPEGW